MRKSSPLSSLLLPACCGPQGARNVWNASDLDSSGTSAGGASAGGLYGSFPGAPGPKRERVPISGLYEPCRVRG